MPVVYFSSLNKTVLGVPLKAEEKRAPKIRRMSQNFRTGLMYNIACGRHLFHHFSVFRSLSDNCHVVRVILLFRRLNEVCVVRATAITYPYPPPLPIGLILSVPGRCGDHSREGRRRSGISVRIGNAEDVIHWTDRWKYLLFFPHGCPEATFSFSGNTITHYRRLLTLPTVCVV